uniref:Uncharacterized protein n=1 Tax=Glossina brevipalpis TaxID=37001 RepID=A0A1A9WFM1_9MUSC
MTNSSKFAAHRQESLNKVTNVHRPIVSHAFLGLRYVKQHMMSDNNWGFQQLADQMENFKRMMKTYQTVSSLEKKADSYMYNKVLKKLRNKVRDGRLLLYTHKNQKQKVTNYFHDKTRICLYKDMSLFEISEKLDQQTFVLRKEHDRLQFRCEELKKKLEALVRRRNEMQKTLGRFYKDITNPSNFGFKKTTVPTENKSISASDLINRYNRSSREMQILEIELLKIKNVIKVLETVTLSSNSTDVYRTIRTQSSANARLLHWLRLGELGNEMLENKSRKSEIVQSLLRHNYAGWPRGNASKAKKLRLGIKYEDEFEADMIQQMKDISPFIVLIRFTLYRLHDMLRVVNYRTRTPAMRHPTEDLKLPLLKFESPAAHTYPPLAFEENLEDLMKVVQEKLKKLLHVFETKTVTETAMEKCRRIYNQQLRSSYSRYDDEDNNSDHLYQRDKLSTDLDEEAGTSKDWAGVPSRARIKQRSATIVEEQKRHITGH